MNNVYFGENGLTSTEANHLCNIAQEKITAISEKLNSIRLYETTIAAIGSSEKQLLSVGVNSLEWVEEAITEIAQMNSFCAWVKEAIKEKENQSKEALESNRNEWIVEHGMTIPKCPERITPPKEITEQDIINSMDVKDRSEYLKYEAFASTFGKVIHPNGSFSKARKEAHVVENNPINKEGSGKDMVLFYHTLTIPSEDIDKRFLVLQEIYRMYEKELNLRKAEIKNEVSRRNIKSEQDYKKCLEQYDLDYKNYATQCSKIHSKFNEWLTSEINRISKLKIIIPENLKDIYNKIKE